jgi:hypothetical protein
MSLTPLQERRLQQVKDEIVFLEKEIKKKDWLFILRFSWITVMVIYITEFLFDFLTVKKSLLVYVHEHGWIRILMSWIFWFVFDYVVMASGNKKNLRLKKKGTGRPAQEVWANRESDFLTQALAPYIDLSFQTFCIGSLQCNHK